MFALLMAGFAGTGNATSRDRPGIEHLGSNGTRVHDLFQVRNMFFFGVGYWLDLVGIRPLAIGKTGH